MDEVCEVCKEGDGPYEDVVANFVDIDARPRLAHEDCGNTMGWELA
jgi:hypothetical protein